MPEVLALREDFPLVPHLNLRREEKPRSLCLYEDPFDILRLRLTAVVLLNRVLEWLNLTARGQLHQHDQPLEPLLAATPFVLVLDRSVVNEQATSAQLEIVGVKDADAVTSLCLPGAPVKT